MDFSPMDLSNKHGDERGIDGVIVHGDVFGGIPIELALPKNGRIP